MAATRGTLGTGENEWYTPSDWLDRARTVLGRMDLDRPRRSLAQRTVKAKQLLPVDDDGLTKAWHGRVWMNPPYAQPAIGNFADKLAAESRSRSCEGRDCAHAQYTDTQWFRRLASRAQCDLRSRGPHSLREHRRHAALRHRAGPYSLSATRSTFSAQPSATLEWCCSAAETSAPLSSGLNGHTRFAITAGNGTRAMSEHMKALHSHNVRRSFRGKIAWPTSNYTVEINAALSGDGSSSGPANRAHGRAYCLPWAHRLTAKAIWPDRRSHEPRADIVRNVRRRSARRRQCTSILPRDGYKRPVTDCRSVGADSGG